MFEKSLRYLIILAASLTGLSTFAQADNPTDPTCWGVVPSVVRCTDGRVLTAYSWNGIEKMIHLYEGEIMFPIVEVSYKDVSHISGNTSRLKSLLNRAKKTKVIVKVPSQCGDANFVDMIETKLSELGLTVLDHHLASGVKNTADIKKASGADILLDVSWLKFSDPDMYAPIDKTKTKVELNLAPTAPSYDILPSEKEFEKYRKKGRKKAKVVGYARPMAELMSELQGLNVYTDKVRDQVVDELFNSNTFATNKNIVSCIFKFVDLSDNSLVASYHLGQQNFDKIPVERNLKLKFENYKINYSKMANDDRHYVYHVNGNYRFYTPYTLEFGGLNKAITGAANAALNYLSFMGNTAVIPGAAQLNDFQDVKVSDEQIMEGGSSRSKTSGSAAGSSRSYYYRGFNPTYYSGYSSSSTNSSYESTTTFKDAQYIRCSDFYGYYNPLTTKLITELKKIVGD